MTGFKKIIACSLTLAIAAGITACTEEAPAGGNTPAAPGTTTAATTTFDPDENASTDREVKDVSTDMYTPDGNAGTVRYLGYYDLSVDQKAADQLLVFTSELYGGTIDYISCPSGDAYYEKLGTLIASDESPDICTHDAMRYPGNVGKNLFEPLDDYIDMNSPLWVDMKPVIESFAYKGKHYKYPH